MTRNLLPRLLTILILAIIAIGIDVSPSINFTNPFTSEPVFINLEPKLGLDLQGGLQVIMEADVAPNETLQVGDMELARTIMENRTNALGVSENVLQLAGDRRIVGEFPGLKDTDSVLATIQQTGLLEFVDTGATRFDPGDPILTDYASGGSQEVPEGAQVYHTIMTGRDLKTVTVTTNQTGGYEINFELSGEGAKIFAAHTAANVGKILTIVLDKTVVSSPSISNAIPDGQGSITGNYTYAEANAFVVQLRSGSLPISLKVVETRIVGPSLGADSLRRSLIAGAIGMLIVMLFMGLYYRLPGIVANIAIVFFALVAFAIFKSIGVTLTLAGIAGFLLSTGSALDANILIFERIKEELRNGKTIAQAIDMGWVRARSSIMDSNIATLLTSGILLWFGSTLGATLVKGFAITLGLGVFISLLTAIFVTRSLLNLAVNTFKPTNLEKWFGI